VNGRAIVLLGMMSRLPVAGVVWQTMHYLVGLERLGYTPYYVEAHARTPGMLMREETDDSSALGAAFIAGVMERFGFGGRWAFHALHDDGRCYGLSERDLRGLYRDAALIVNLHGGTFPLPEHAQTGRLVLVETDPVRLQVGLHEGRRDAVEFLEPHCALFTFAENFGREDCLLPGADRYAFRPTRQPVVLDFWRDGGDPRPCFTTIGSWRQFGRDVELDGELYTWSKHHEFEKVIGLPQLVRRPLELALAGYEREDRARLEAHGWRVRRALRLSADLDRYREYVQRSAGELTVAKDQNIRLRTGWFSDRSATYLAAGRPVITQDTGFGVALPTGAGLLAFATADEARAALDEVDRDYERHARAAGELAREHFDAERVLAALLTEVGLEAHPPDLVLAPVSRWPTTLADETVRAVLDRPVPRPHAAAPAGDPEASVVVVTFDNLVFTRLCLESVLEHTDVPAYELVVIDNGSTDGTVEYLHALAREDRRVQLELSGENAGFARAANRGLAAARGRLLILLNNDTLVAPGWLARLAGHLEDAEIGLVTPVTNRAGGEAEVETSYETGSGFLGQAAERSRARAGENNEIGQLIMFCAALRREVYDQVGPLDERFGLGMFEDDDYVLRVRDAGYRVVRGEDVLVHHFGQATIGKLARTGEYGALFHENRRRFEEKWSRSWQPHARTPSEGYGSLVERVRSVADRAVPPDAAVLVVSRGDDALVELGRRSVAHFPQAADGVYAGYHPADSDQAIAHLEELRAAGAEFLVLPQPSFWWLDHYEGFRSHLERRYSVVAHDEESCLVFALGGRS
jgi:GT2 family glycosyltransferase